MKKEDFLCAFMVVASIPVFGQHPDFVPPKDIPRNIIIIMANGMGTNQITAASIKKGAPLSFSRFPVMGLVQPFAGKSGIPDDSCTANAVATNLTARNAATNPASTPTKTLFDWAKEKKMTTGLITTGTVTGETPKFFLLDKPYGKDDEALALDYLTSGFNMLMGGGSRYFDRRYDGRSLLTEFSLKGYKLENNLNKVGDIMIPKTLAIVAKNSLFSASERKDFLTKSLVNTARIMNNPDGYVLVVNDTKIEEADTLNNTQYLTEEMLDLDKAVSALYQQAGGETLIIVLGNFEAGGLTIKDTKSNKKNDPDVSWNAKTPTACLAPIFAMGPGSSAFTGIYNQTDIYAKLEAMMQKRR